jgi:hypothetical protein
MATPRITHIQRERAVLIDLEASFPNFMGQAHLWTEVPEGQDPPDFICREAGATIGLELREWLDGDQMRAAKGRESQRDQIHRILSYGWEQQYQPRNFRGAFPSPVEDERISRADEQQLREEFFACAAAVDRAWANDSDHWGNSHYLTEFPGYQLLTKYFSPIRYIGGEPHGLNWIGEQGDGEAFDPNIPVESLNLALDSKLSEYSTPEKQAHLFGHGLTELDLLVHGGFNIYAYNTPAGHLSLDEIARRGADYYAAHPLRHVFNRVWFFHSLDSADELNQLLGVAPDERRVRWLAELWPHFRIFPGSVAEVNSILEPNSDYARSGAYHEAAHVVIGAVLGIPLTEKGLHLDRWGNGIAHYHDKKPDGSANLGPETGRERTIIATAAGWIAQNRMYSCSQSGAHLDIDQINALLTEMYPDRSPSWCAAKTKLLREAEQLVEVHWVVIESVALALWAKPEVPKTDDWTPEPNEKHLSVQEILEILREAGISARVERR